MVRWRPVLDPPLSETDLEGILNRACRVLEQVGVECTHRETRHRLLDHGGVSRRGDRLHFEMAHLLDRVEAVRAGAQAVQDDEDGELTMGACWACLFYCEPTTQEVRPATAADAEAMARLWDARGLAGPVPVTPGHVPPGLATLEAERIALIHSARLGGGLTATDPDEVRLLIDMNQAAGRRYRLLCQVGISPLRLNGEGLSTALAFLENPDVAVEMAGAIPMAGATCPLDPRSALVQSVAEALAMEQVELALGQPGALGLRVEPFDFQYATIVFGSPEWCLYRAMVLQVSHYLTGRKPRNGSFRSTAKQPDGHAAAERTASVLWQALLGVRHFGAVGQLSVDEVFSPQQAVIDRDILSYVARLVRGISPAVDSGDPVDLIRRGMAAGGFAGLEETARGFREMYSFPDLFRHWNVGRWKAEGGPGLLDEAWERAQAEIATSTHALPPDQHREVERLYAAGAEHIRTGRS